MVDAEVEPVGYAELLERLKERVRSSRVRAARAANTELLLLYWQVGRDILERQDVEGLGREGRRSPGARFAHRVP